ncbi:hypothetical protein E1218_25910 [Kribbella turkmenica]|uniref:ImmA/IrrE family metallo-endopeptidase n=1 Tax=Kribbella turkmenica TaxID=2530375 RepID=A0A4R4WLP7_9ACTN|nr:hypothetical protein [Kribbella turkmenica]TDD18467.1 hypothetical protein E1218_25910 [Kribbella turkmenica]
MPINLQLPQASWVAHAHVWEQLGRRVKSEQAIRILAPVRWRTATASALEPGAGHAGAGVQVEEQVIGFRVRSVYDVTATSGPPIYLPRTLTSADFVVARTLWDALAREVAADGFAVDVRPLGDGCEGFTDFDSGRIVIADRPDDFRAVARLAHEVRHARMHASERGGDEVCEGLREVEAESVAYVVLGRYGIAIEAESFSYIWGWAKVADPDEPENVIMETGVRVINTARTLIEPTDEYLKVHGALLAQEPGRAMESPSSHPELDGPVP